MTSRLPALRLARIGLVTQLVASLFLGVLAPSFRTVEALPPEPLSGDVVSAQLVVEQSRLPRAVTADTYWTTELVDPGATVGAFSSLAIDSSDDLHVAYYDGTNTALRYARFAGTAWFTTTVDNSGSVGQYASLGLDDSELPHISYYESESGLRHAYVSGHTWATEPIDYSADVGEHSSLVVGTTSDDILISYYDSSNQSLKFARFHNTTWVSMTLDAGPGVGQGTAIDATRYPHIVYYDANTNQLRYTENTSLGWDDSKSPVNDPGDSGESVSMALDSDRNPHVSYFNNSVMYTYYDDVRLRWYEDEIQYFGSEPTAHTSIVVDANDVPHIAYTDDVGSGHLYYAYLDGYTWVTETIESANVEGYPSIAIDSDGLPHITYQSSTGLTHTWLRIKSDLIVTDIWDDGGQVWFQVQNVGQGTAPAGHQVALTVDSVASGTSMIPVDLAPGERYAGVVTTLTCSGVYDTLVLTADSGGVVVESDETNNVRQETWDCDTTAPTITSGPTATSVTTNSATIQWTTDDDSDSYVYYDSSFIDGSSPYEFEDGVYVTSHSIQLTGLEPGTVYRYLVQSRDPDNDKTVTSGESFFETAALPSAPFSGTITVTRSRGDYPSYDVVVAVDTSASRAIARTVDHVRLEMDGVVVGTAYAPIRVVGGKSQYNFTVSPNGLNLSRNEFFVDPEDQAHNLEATVVTPDITEIISETFGPPREEILVDVTMQTPTNNWVYYADEFGDLPPGTTIQVSAEAIQYEWECEWVGSSASPDCGDVAQQMDQVAFYVDGELKHTSYSPFLDFTHLFEYNAENLGVGTHTFQVLALDNDGEWRPSNAHTIIVEQGDPTLTLERTVTRNGNVFEVALDISLDDSAAGPAYLDRVRDYADEFIPVTKETSTYDVFIEYPAYLGVGERRSEITIDFSSGGNDWVYLAPGNTVQVTYQLVPILYEDGQANPRLGHPNTRVYYSYEGEDTDRTFDLYWQDLSSVQTALGTSDYIIVTNPTRLHDLYVEDEVHDLLGTMAHLAAVRNGVLGFLETYVGTYADSSDDVLRDLTDGGYWANTLHPSFQDTLEGYMLIVGETEVVPAFDSHNYDICWSIPDDDWHCRVGDNDVYHHDQWYSTTSGNGKPELIVGRIIGDSAWQLERPLIVSIGIAESNFGHYYAPGNAMLASGYGNSTEERAMFDDHIDTIDMILDNLDDPSEDRWIVDVRYLPDTFPELALDTGFSQDISLAHLMGHGSYDGWASALDSDDPPDLYGYMPFVFAPSCLTGNYEAGDDYNLAESLFDQGVSAYIGSTQISPVDTNDEVAVHFYVKWDWEEGESLARAFAQTERAFYDDWAYYDWYRFWVVEYNFYGDPKFGASSSALPMRADRAVSTVPTTTLGVQVPDYVVTTTVDGFDQVTIPGGRLVREGGLHEIPYWTASVDYAPGYRVQGVTLTLRSGYAFTTGLVLPTAVITYYVDGPFTSSGTATETLTLPEDDDWLPALDEIYDWDVTLNPDGSSELEIDIFPFHYQPATTNIEWYDAFTFTIDVISTSVTIDGFELGQGTYDLGDVITGDLWFDNPGDAQDLILDVSVRNLVTGEIIDVLPLDMLHDVAGPGYYPVDWDSTGFDPGEYLLWVDLRDSEGNLLDSASEMFRLGVPFAEIAEFSATPGLFQPGDGVDISMTISNTGSVAVSGEAVVKVFATGVSTPTAVFSQTVTDLAPDNTVVFDPVWDTTGATDEEYRVIGYMKYSARTTEVETSVVSTRAYIYLPLVLRH